MASSLGGGRASVVVRDIVEILPNILMVIYSEEIYWKYIIVGRVVTMLEGLLLCLQGCYYVDSVVTTCC